MPDADLIPRPNDPLRRALDRTPARLAVGRSGPAYRTDTWLALRADHAAARDAVQAELDLIRDFGPERVDHFRLFWSRTNAPTKQVYLMRPDLGRRLDDDSRALIRTQCPAGCDLQVVIGDGLSATAVAAQAPPLLDGLKSEAGRHGWKFGRPFLVRFCRVGVMNDVGDLLDPSVVVLLIGERPGLATAESLSAYLAYRPRTGQTDADRNLISNIHTAGVGIPEAVMRIAALSARFMELHLSGCAVKESVPVPDYPETGNPGEGG
jgi:ethanolamine ammonia-lyase small subunit